jgi:cellulose synthase/poly-beta-1,6-N-acetylglucosamine synthase-like glycosyltransferase
MRWPNVSIIIPSRNSKKTIRKLLDSIFSMHYPKNKYEVIVVDSSTDDTAEIVKKYPVKLIKISSSKTRNIAIACNIGAKTSRGTFLAFVDADCSIGRNWLKDLISSFSSKEIACVGGKVVTYGNIFDEYARIAFKSPVRNINKKYVTDVSNFHKRMWPIGCNFMIRKNIIEEIGYFDEELQFYEEVDLFWRICRKGYKLLLIPKAKVKHSYQRNFFEMLKTYFRYGKGCGYFCKKYKNSKFAKIHLLLFCSILTYFLTAFLLFFQSHSFYFFVILPAVLYFYLFSYYLSKKNKFAWLFPLLDFIFCGVAYMSGFLYSLLFVDLLKIIKTKTIYERDRKIS